MMEQTDDIAHVLDNIPPTIDEALEIAIANGEMTIKEAEEAKENYYSVFHK